MLSFANAFVSPFMEFNNLSIFPGAGRFNYLGSVLLKTDSNNFVNHQFMWLKRSATMPYWPLPLAVWQWGNLSRNAS